MSVPIGAKSWKQVDHRILPNKCGKEDGGTMGTPLVFPFIIFMTSPEKHRAFTVIASVLERWKSLFHNDPIVSLVDGAVAFCHEPCQLPKSDQYTWNKSSGEISLPIGSTGQIRFQKMNAKKKKSCQHLPAYKVWLYSISAGDDSPHLFAFWCERGHSSEHEYQNGIAHSHAPCQKNSMEFDSAELRLEDLSFLRRFVDPAVAREFGWV